MKPETYYKKYGCIYGISYKDGWENGYSVRFTSLDDAREWLHTERYDFSTRELCSKSEALRYLTCIISSLVLMPVSPEGQSFSLMTCSPSADFDGWEFPVYCGAYSSFFTGCAVLGYTR